MSDYDKKWYSSLKKPLLTPPSYIFGIVWPILYILISISAYIVWKNEKCFPYCSALTFFFIQLFFNLSWSNIFFKKKDVITGLYIIIYMIIFTLLTMLKFYNIDINSFYLLIPYLVWITFALYINVYIYKKN